MTPAAGNLTGGGVSERPKERASKAREVKASAGSNPAATASLTRPSAGPAVSLVPALCRWSQMWTQLVPIGASLLEYELFLQAYERIEPWFADILVASPGYGETPKPDSGRPIA
jgi:hypothetical protein